MEAPLSVILLFVIPLFVIPEGNLRFTSSQTAPYEVAAIKG
jgi:hypothetical protein